MVIEVFWWILLLLCGLGCFVPNDPKWAWTGTGSRLVILILIGILGFWHHNPFN